MNKRLLTILSIPLLITLSGCNKVESLSRDPEVEIETIETPNDKLVNELEEEEYNKFPVNYLTSLNKHKTYKAVTSGDTVTNIIFSKVVQKIDVTSIKGEYSYQHNASSSSSYSSEHTAYYHDDKVIYKNKSEKEYTSSSMDEYLDKYGTYPFNNTIEGYKISNEAITSVSKEISEQEDEYIFKLVFDPEKATNNVRIQMKEFGQLNDYPVFKDILILLTVKNDYTPIKLELESHYKAKKIIETSCHQQYKVTFSNFDEEIEIPDLESVKTLFE